MALLFKSKGTVGLDIGSSTVKLIELKPGKRKGYQLVNLGVASLPPEAIVDGALMNSSVVVEAIRSILGSLKLKTRDVATSISGHSVIIKKINLPVMTSEELEESIQWEAEQYIPFDINDVNIDFQIVGTEESEAGQMGVLLVAAKKDMINDYTTVIQEAGLNPVVIDVDAFAVENMYEANYSLQPGEIIALVNLGASIININILKGGFPTFTRDISAGGTQYNEEIQKSLNISFEEAERMKMAGKAEEDMPLPQEISGIVESVSDSLSSEVQRSLDFFSATATEDKINKVILCGGCARTVGLDRAIAEKSGYPVEVANPFNNIEVSPRAFDADYIANIAPATGVAVGLALRWSGDKK